MNKTFCLQKCEPSRSKFRNLTVHADPVDFTEINSDRRSARVNNNGLLQASRYHRKHRNVITPRRILTLAF